MRLLLTELEQNSLIEKRLLEYVTNDVWKLSLKPDLDGNSCDILVTTLIDSSTGELNLENNHTIESIVVKKSNQTEIFDLGTKKRKPKKTTEELSILEQNYIKYRLCFPSDVNEEIGLPKGGRTLRSGVVTKIKSKLEEALQTYSIEDICGAVKLEVNERKQRSSANKNDLQFMHSMQPWLNNTENLQTYVEKYRNLSEQNNIDSKNTIGNWKNTTEFI